MYSTKNYKDEESKTQKVGDNVWPPKFWLGMPHSPFHPVA